jgi:hypothetical protein
LSDEQPTSATAILLRKLTAHLAGDVIAISAQCRRCGYDLKGLSATSQCPECGLPLVESVLAIVDPDASTMPRLRDPKGVGNGLLWLTMCGLAGVLLLLAGPVAIWLGATGWGRELLHPMQGPLVAAVCFVSGLWSVARLRPQTPGDPVRRYLRLITVGLLGTAVLSVVIWIENRGATAPGTMTRNASLLLICISGVLGLVGIGGVLETIGQRSLAYRRSHAARQGVQAMIAAVVGSALGVAARAMAPHVDAPLLESGGTVLLRVSVLMIVIGLAYMVLNAWWIRTAIRRPAPSIEQLLAPALPDPTEEA